LNLYEYEAKEIFADYGITIPPGVRITKPEQLAGIHFGYPLTLKCQVLTGGRGKAGGIKFGKDLKDAQTLAKDLLQLSIKGIKTDSLLVEPKVAIKKELYLAVLLDRSRGCPVFLASAEGGIEIESSGNVVTMPIPYPFHSYVARELAKQLGLSKKVLNKVADIATKLYQCYDEMDLDLAEINPLVITEGDDVLALDGKMVVNDDAIDRHPKAGRKVTLQD
jgi:succinyl-CoA synthetase beta subunit